MSMSLLSRPVVAVTQRIDLIKGRGEQRDAIDQRLLEWLLQAELLPVTVPNIFAVEHGESGALESSELSAWLGKVKPGALLLSGGNDIGEFPRRDLCELFLLAWAEVRKLPVLGICRGMQMLAVHAGIDLVPVTGHVGTRHKLKTSTRSESTAWPEQVNSYHNWGLSECPPDFDVSATVEDGSIEAISHARMPWEGWMWHPERESKFAYQDTSRLRRLFLGKE